MKNGKRVKSDAAAYNRLLLLALAAMATARLVLLMVDIIQARAGGFGGEITIPAYVIAIFAAGWKLREWTAKPKRKEDARCRKAHTSASAPIVEHTLTLEKPATVGWERRKTGS